jgi:hypothetical protein
MHRRRSRTPIRPSHALLAVAALSLVTSALGSCTAATPVSSASVDVPSMRSEPRPTPTDPTAPQVVGGSASSPTVTGPVEIASGIITRPFSGGREAGRITVTDTGRARDLEMRLSGFDDVPESIDVRLLTGPFTPIEGCLPDVFTKVAAFGAFQPGQGEGLTTSFPRGWGISLLQDGDAHVMLTVQSAMFPEEGTCLYPVLAEGDITWRAR